MVEIFKYMPPIKYAEMLAYSSRVKANTYFKESLKKLSKGGDGSDHVHFSLGTSASIYRSKQQL